MAVSELSAVRGGQWIGNMHLRYAAIVSRKFACLIVIMFVCLFVSLMFVCELFIDGYDCDGRTHTWTHTWTDGQMYVCLSDYLCVCLTVCVFV